MVRSADSSGLLEAWWHARNVKQAIPTMVRIASERADRIELPAIHNQASVRTKPPGGRNSKKSAYILAP